MQQLSKDEDVSAIDFQRPERPLDSIVLPGDLGGRVGELIHEWGQVEKLLQYGMQPRNRMLLHGPSGNGKTTLAAAIATELALPLAYVQYSALISKWVGDTHPRIAKVFREASSRPCVLFFDEADSLCASRSEGKTTGTREHNLAVNTLLLELDRLPQETVVIFATNFAQVLDPAMRRRVTLTLELPAPDVADLRRLLTTIRRKHPLWPLDDFDVEACGATSFATCEQMAIDHARRIILRDDFDPLGLTGKPRSAWLREQIERAKEESEREVLV